MQTGIAAAMVAGRRGGATSGKKASRGRFGAFECDELVPVSRGGSPYDRENVAPAHRICNNWRGDRPVGWVLSVRSRVLARFGRWSTPQQFVAFAKALDGGRAPSAASAPRVTTDW